MREKIQLKPHEGSEYFSLDPDIVLEKGDRVIIEIDHEKRSATWMIVPEGENPGNFVPEDDDYDRVIMFLYERDYHTPDIIAARKSQVGWDDR